MNAGIVPVRTALANSIHWTLTLMYWMTQALSSSWLYACIKSLGLASLIHPLQSNTWYFPFLFLLMVTQIFEHIFSTFTWCFQYLEKKVKIRGWSCTTWQPAASHQLWFGFHKAMETFTVKDTMKESMFPVPLETIFKVFGKYEWNQVFLKLYLYIYIFLFFF